MKNKKVDLIFLPIAQTHFYHKKPHLEVLRHIFPNRGKNIHAKISVSNALS